MFTQDESYIKWKLFLEGDDQAYSWIYTHYIQVLYNYGLQITPDSEIVKDCIQDVFVKIYKAKKKLTVSLISIGSPSSIGIFIPNTFLTYWEKA